MFLSRSFFFTYPSKLRSLIIVCVQERTRRDTVIDLTFFFLLNFLSLLPTRNLIYEAFELSDTSSPKFRFA